MRLLSNASDSNNNVWRSQKFDFNAKENDHFTLTCYYSIELRVCIEGCWAAKKFDIKALRNHDNNTQGKTWSMNLRVGDSARYIPRCFTSQYIISTTTVCIHLPFGDSCVLYLPCSTGTCVWDHLTWYRALEALYPWSAWGGSPSLVGIFFIQYFVHIWNMCFFSIKAYIMILYYIGNCIVHLSCMIMLFL